MLTKCKDCVYESNKMFVICSYNNPIRYFNDEITAQPQTTPIEY
jgi:hypothetical protein